MCQTQKRFQTLKWHLDTFKFNHAYAVLPNFFAVICHKQKSIIFIEILLAEQSSYFLKAFYLLILFLTGT